MEQYHKATFARIDAAKQRRILDSAIQIFAAQGFTAANINVIARKAGISIGAMYKYFSSKEDLYLTVVDQAYRVLEDAIHGIADAPGGLFTKLERLVLAAQEYARRYPELNQIYLDMTSEGLAHLSRKLSGKLETISATLYRKLLKEAIRNGSVAPEIDVDVAAFCIDNLILTLQYSYTSDYFKERLKIFVGESALSDDVRIRQGLMRFMRAALEPPGR